jgi:hypothetical protein
MARVGSERSVTSWLCHSGAVHGAVVLALTVVVSYTPSDAEAGTPYSRGKVTARRNGHALRVAVGGRRDPDYLATKNGPKDRRGNIRIGDRYVDSLHYRAYRQCESDGDRWAFNRNDADAGGPRFSYYQFARSTWHYAGGYANRRRRDPFNLPWNAPLWYQTYRVKRLFQKEFVRGPGKAWRYPPLTHVGSCRDELKGR